MENERVVENKITSLGGTIIHQMCTMKSNGSLFQFSLKSFHHIASVAEGIAKCFNISRDKVDYIEIDKDIQVDLNEEAVVYLSVTYRAKGFETFVEVEVVKYSDLNLSLSSSLICLSGFFNDDTVSMLNDDSFLLARGSILYQAEFEILNENGEEQIFLNETSLRQALW